MHALQYMRSTVPSLSVALPFFCASSLRLFAFSLSSVDFGSFNSCARAVSTLNDSPLQTEFLSTPLLLEFIVPRWKHGETCVANLSTARELVISVSAFTLFYTLECRETRPGDTLCLDLSIYDSSDLLYIILRCARSCNSCHIQRSSWCIPFHYYSKPNIMAGPASFDTPGTAAWVRNFLTSLYNLFTRDSSGKEAESDAVEAWVGVRKGRRRCRSIGDVQ